MRALVLVASGLLALCGVAACIDGVTPDCSNPAVCAPIEGDPPAGSADATTDTSTAPPDTGTPSPTPDASSADAKPPVDAAADG